MLEVGKGGKATKVQRDDDPGGPETVRARPEHAPGQLTLYFVLSLYRDTWKIIFFFGHFSNILFSSSH